MWGYCLIFVLWAPLAGCAHLAMHKQFSFETRLVIVVMVGVVQGAYLSPCPGLGIKLNGHRHSDRCRSLLTVSKRRVPTDEGLVKLVVTMVEHLIRTGQVPRPVDGAHSTTLGPLPIGRPVDPRFLAPRPKRDWIRPPNRADRTTLRRSDCSSPTTRTHRHTTLLQPKPDALGADPQPLSNLTQQ